MKVEKVAPLGDRTATAVDPVSGMSVALKPDTRIAAFGGKEFHFRSEKCQTKFKADPWYYASGKARTKGHAVASAAQYTSPMHPQVLQDIPRNCPICGMTLETVVALEKASPELADLTRRMWISAAAAVPLVILTMGGMVGLPVRDWIGHGLAGYLEFALATPILIWAAWPFFQRGWASVTNRSPDMRARERTGDAIRGLLDLAPKTRRRILPDGTEYDAPLANFMAGDTLRVRPGDAVSVDGVIDEGATWIGESLMTGEAMPVEKAVGDTVTGGTINKNGALVMTAGRVGADTVLALIVTMVSNAKRFRAPIQGVADKILPVFVPVVLLIAVAAFVAWMIWGPAPALTYAVTAAVSVLLGLATPISITTAAGRGAQAGVLIKDAEALERMAVVDALNVDMTGTLTDVVVLAGVDEVTILTLAAALEKASQHPLAEAIVAGAAARGIADGDTGGFEAVTGKGVQGTVSGRKVALGDAAMMPDLGLNTQAADAQADTLRATGKTAMFVAVDGALALADPVRATTSAAIKELHAQALRIIMAMGDNARTAQAVAGALGIDELRAGVLPDEKRALTETRRMDGRKVAMAGDGVNDAPALAAADVGIATGTGADVAVESAGMTLLGGDLMGIMRARKLARATVRNTKQHLFFTFAFNAVGIPVAAGVLYPVTGTLLSPMIAAAAMSLSSLFVITNALRLQRVDL